MLIYSREEKFWWEKYKLRGSSKKAKMDVTATFKKEEEEKEEESGSKNKKWPAMMRNQRICLKKMLNQ